LNDSLNNTLGFISKTISISERLKQTLPIWYYSKYYLYNFSIPVFYITKIFNKIFDESVYAFYTNDYISKNSVILTNTKSITINCF
jgi:hypothetical protein